MRPGSKSPSRPAPVKRTTRFAVRDDDPSCKPRGSACVIDQGKRQSRRPRGRTRRDDWHTRSSCRFLGFSPHVPRQFRATGILRQAWRPAILQVYSGRIGYTPQGKRHDTAGHVDIGSRPGLVGRLRRKRGSAHQASVPVPDRTRGAAPVPRRQDRLGQHDVPHAPPARRSPLRPHPWGLCLRVRSKSARLPGTDDSRLIRISASQSDGAATGRRALLSPRVDGTIAGPSLRPRARAAAATACDSPALRSNYTAKQVHGKVGAWRSTCILSGSTFAASSSNGRGHRGGQFDSTAVCRRRTALKPH
jgi:hypothetical protein